MRHHLEKLLRWPWLPLILLCALASWAFLLRGSLPRETDAELHVFRTAELAYALREGVLYPRWAPDFYYGYGYPIFNYYAPLTYYLANVFALANPAWAVFGTKAVFVSGLWLGGFGVYGFTRRWAAHTGGLVAAATFLFAPYVFSTGTHLRGVLAESFATGLLPFVLWGAAAHLDQTRGKTFVWLSGGLAALMLSHNIIGPVGFALVAGYVVWRGLIVPALQGTFVRAQLWHALPPIVLGAGLSAFFWLNVFLEADAVQLGNLVGPGNFDFRNHFLTPRELLLGPGPVDLGAVNPPFQLYAGWAAALLAGAGLLALLRNKTEPHEDTAAEGLYFGTAGLGLAFLTLRMSQGIWETLSPMAFIQFPWRLLGPLALCLAVLAGLSVRWLPARWRGLVLAVPLIGALGFFSPPNWGDFGPTNRLAMLEFELNGLALGTTSTGDFVPVEVDVVPGPIETVIASYRAGGPVDRVNRVTLPEGTTTELQRQTARKHVYITRSEEPFTLRLYHFDFAGWRASIDGQRVPIEVAKPEGWMTVAVPAGEHEVVVRLGSTPTRTITTAISGAALIGLAVGSMAYRRQKAVTEPAPVERATGGGWVPLVIIGGIVLLAVLGVFQPRSTGIIAQPAQVDRYVITQGGIDLLGYRVRPQRAGPGDRVSVTLYWKAREPLDVNYQAFAHLTTTPNDIWVQSDKLNPGGYPTTRWPTDRYVRDAHTLHLPEDIPPGEYTIRVGIYDLATGTRQLAFDSQGELIGDSIPLTLTITVK